MTWILYNQITGYKTNVNPDEMDYIHSQCIAVELIGIFAQYHTDGSFKMKSLFRVHENKYFTVYFIELT